MSVAAALQLISTIRSLPPPTNPRAHRDARARTYGGQLAATYNADVFHEVLARHGNERDLLDLFACWMQELVVRGATVGGPFVDALVEKLVATDHPLAHLPAYRLPVEELDTETMAEHEPWQAMPVRLDAHTATEIPSPEDLGALYEAHRQTSNGVVETRSFVLDPPMRRAPDPELLQALGLACLSGSLRVVEVPFAVVFHSMTATARWGGAYESATSQAFSRHYVWRTLAAFAGLARDANLHDIAAICERMYWTLFEATGTWFKQVAWDYALAGISPDGAILHVFAGTDTD